MATGQSLSGDIPASVAAVAAGRRLRSVWLNAIGGRTFEVGAGQSRLFVKWAPPGEAHRLEAEVPRLRWARPYSAVPQLLDAGADEEGAWIVTAALPGTNAVAERWVKDPARAVRGIGEGLRRLHEELPVDDCPFSWAATERLADAQRRCMAGLIDQKGFHENFRHLAPEEALVLLAEVPEIDVPVVCQGDACSPNTLLDTAGRCCGHVDLGALGVADRWADLAIAAWSATWNYGPGWEEALLAAYGVEPDPVRIAYYRLLWDLGP